MTITTDALVVPFYYRGDDSRDMRVVVTHDNDVAVEQWSGRDSLGVERWVTVDYEDDETETFEWVGMVACALAHAYRERLPSGDAPRFEALKSSVDRERGRVIEALGAAGLPSDLSGAEGIRELTTRLAAKVGDAPTPDELCMREDAYWLVRASMPRTVGATVAEAIRSRRDAGESVASLARDYGVSTERIMLAVGCDVGDAPPEPSADPCFDDAYAGWWAANGRRLTDKPHKLQGEMESICRHFYVAGLQVGEASRPPGGAEPDKREAVLRAHLVPDAPGWWWLTSPDGKLVPTRVSSEGGALFVGMGHPVTAERFKWGGRCTPRDTGLRAKVEAVLDAWDPGALAPGLVDAIRAALEEQP